jgi:hypothetical protein
LVALDKLELSAHRYSEELEANEDEVLGGVDADVE